MEEERKIAEVNKITLFDTLGRSKKHVFIGIGLAIILVGLSLTIFMVQKSQDPRSRADGGTSVFLSASPSFYNTVIGKDQVVELIVDTAGVDLIGIDVVITYPTGLVRFSSFEPSKMFGKHISQQAQLSPGKYKITYIVDQVGKAVRGNLSLGKIKFKTLSVGLADISLFSAQAVTLEGEIKVESSIKKVIPTSKVSTGKIKKIVP